MKCIVEALKKTKLSSGLAKIFVGVRLTSLVT